MVPFADLYQDVLTVLWSALWFIALAVMLILFAGLLVGGTIFGIGDLRSLLRDVSAHKMEDYGDDGDLRDEIAQGLVPPQE